MSTITPLPEPTDPRQVFAAEVRSLMGRHNVNQSQLAILLEIGQSEFSKRLRGVIPFKLDEISRSRDQDPVSCHARDLDRTHSAAQSGNEGVSRHPRRAGRSSDARARED